jgi:hypothetical protein
MHAPALLLLPQGCCLCPQLVLGICAAAKSKGNARWKSLDIQVCVMIA